MEGCSEDGIGNEMGAQLAWAQVQQHGAHAQHAVFSDMWSIVAQELYPYYVACARCSVFRFSAMCNIVCRMCAAFSVQWPTGVVSILAVCA